MNAKIIALLAAAAVAFGIYYVMFSEDATAPDPTTVEVEVTETISENTEPVTETGTESSPTDTAPTPAPSQNAPVTQTTNPPTNQTPPPPTEPALPWTAVVTYDGNRFLPEEVTILQGGTVYFRNASDEVKMWVASDLHPTHTSYPLKSDDNCLGSDFDQCTAVGQGGTWSFTFDRFGTWDYHNHVRAKDRAEVEVITREEWEKRQ